MVDETVSLREENKRRTTRRIVEAAAALIRERGTSDFSMPEVADRSGVSLRTLYRYFPRRENLVAAVGSVADQAVALAPPSTIDELEPWLLTAWSNLLEEEALIRAQHNGPAGTEVRSSRAAAHRAATTQVINTLAPDLDADEAAEIIDLALLLTSSAALFEFLDVVGLTVERAAHVAAGTVATLLRP